MNQQIGNARSGGDIYMIAVLGPKGTFCDKSYEEYNKKYEAVHGKSLEPLYCPTIDDVFEQLCTNEACEYAVVPVENMLDGYVKIRWQSSFHCLPMQRR